MEQPGAKTKQSYGLLILSISLATFMASLDGTIVNIALPTISAAFNISSTTVSWVATAYLLVMAGCVLVFGKISDIVGFKKIFLLGFIIFTIGSFCCGSLPDLLHSFPILIVSRLFQAVGGAMITAIAPAMVTAYIPMEQKGKAMGVIMTLAGLGTALGPCIGGFLTQFLSWHWIFFINIPVGIVAVLLGAKVIPHSVARGDMASFDRKGAGLIFVGLASLLFVVSEGGDMGWTSPQILLLALVAVFTIGWFVWHELKVADPLLDLRLFKNRNFLAANLLISLVFFSFSGINYLLPFYLQYVRSVDTSTSGLIMSALSFAMMGAGILAGILYNRMGPRKLCIIAAFFLLAGYLMMTRLHADTSIGYVATCLAVIGFGLGLVITPVSNMIMLAVARSKQGMVSSLTSLERFAPLTLGIAFYNLIFIGGVNAMAKAHEVTKSSPASVQVTLLAAGFDFAFLFAVIIGVVICILAFIARPEIHPDNMNAPSEELGGGML